MLNMTLEGNGAPDRPALVLMHFLGGSGREWDETVVQLGPEYMTVRLDLPGFGGSADETGYSVAAMADAVEETLDGLHLPRFVLVGHSMSGKVAMLIARRMQSAGARGLAGLLLVAPSPPGPEPMSEEKRGGMIALLGEGHHADDFRRARSYITKNGERDIPSDVEARAANEVLRMNRTAWAAWVSHGSREDWGERIGVLDLPALVVAGETDKSLGPDIQKQVTMSHLGRGRLIRVEGCSHLVPMERPKQMADILRMFVESLTMSADVTPAYRALMEGERVSPRTREVLEQRLAGPARTEGLLMALEERTLRAMLARIVPQPQGETIDLAGFVLARLASGKGDGWRYDILPADLDAYRAGLARLAGQGFERMDATAQDRTLAALAEVKGSADARWFEEVRSDATEAYMAHPATLARIGYSGIGVGNKATPHQGFVTIGPNEREAWEPVAVGR